MCINNTYNLGFTKHNIIIVNILPSTILCSCKIFLQCLLACLGLRILALMYAELSRYWFMDKVIAEVERL